MRKTLWLAAMAFVLVTACAAPGQAQKGGTYTAVVPVSTQYEDLSIQWWQWVLSMPLRMPVYTGAVYHPLFDMTGAAAWNGQDVSDGIFFLGGAMGAFDGAGNLIAVPTNKRITRYITIPPNTRLFFPVLNLETDNVGVVPPMSAVALQQLANDLVSTYEDMFAIVDGKPIANLWSYRIRSRPFNYWLPPEDNLYQGFGIDVAGTISPAISDGIYLLLEPLPVGQHVIESGGTGYGGAFKLDVRYYITVAAK